MLVTSIFSSAVFGENPRYCYSLGVCVVVVVIVQKTDICNISVITEGIYLKRGLYVHYPKSNPYYQGRQFKMLFFFRIMPPLDFDFLSLIKHSHSPGLAPACDALVAFSHNFFKSLFQGR